jgi:anti-anti-sigma regulatory factor
MCPDSEPRFAAIVLLLGEDDVTTADLVGETIDRVEGSVLVDLSECSFIDSTTIGKLIATAQTLERRG